MKYDRNKVYKRNSSGRLVQEHGMRRGSRRFQQGGHAHTQTPYLHTHQDAMKHTHGEDGQANWSSNDSYVTMGNNPNSPYTMGNVGPSIPWQGGLNNALRQTIPAGTGPPAGYYTQNVNWQGVSSGTHGHTPGQQPMGRRSGVTNPAMRRRGGRAGRRRLSRGRRRY